MPRRKTPAPTAPTYSAENPQPSPDEDEPIHESTELPPPCETVRAWLPDGRMTTGMVVGGRWWSPEAAGYIEPVRWQRMRERRFITAMKGE